MLTGNHSFGNIHGKNPNPILLRHFKDFDFQSFGSAVAKKTSVPNFESSPVTLLVVARGRALLRRHLGIFTGWKKFVVDEIYNLQSITIIENIEPS